MSVKGDPAQNPVASSNSKISPKLVKVTEDEVIKLQWETISNWKPAVDVWPFTYGVGFLSACAALTSVYLNGHYRRVTRLGRNGQLATLLPAVVVPSLLVAGFHLKYVSTRVVLAVPDGRGATYGGPCPVCVEARAVAVQLLAGVVYPLVLTPLGVFTVAARYYTYAVPPMRPVGYFVRHWWKITKPRMNAVYVVTALQVALAVAITHLEFGAMDRIDRKLVELSRQSQCDDRAATST